MSVSQLNASSVSDLKKKQDDVGSKTADVKKRLSNTRWEMSETLAEVVELDAELEVVTEEIEFITEQLEKVVALLGQTENELVVAEQEREDQFEALKSRVRYMHENGASGYLQILFKASSISDLLNRIDYINQIISYDKNIFEKLRDTEDFIAGKKEIKEKQIREIEVMQTQQMSKKANLEETRAKKTELVTLLTQEEKRYQKQIDDLEAENKRFEQLIKDAEAEAKRLASMKTVYTGGAVSWPVPSSQKLSSPFGNRINPINKKPEHHKGIDIGASYGANIIAAEGGTVISSEWSGGYGNTVIIFHGNGLSTLYAHCSSVLVAKGAAVTKGQVIAKIGSTGYSTGPHLHFEVRLNGVAQNPIPTYIKRN